MDNDNNEQEIKQLHHKISELEQALNKTRSELDDCRQQLTQSEPEPLSEQKQLEYQNQQNELFNHFKICEANWVDIPPGKVNGQEIPAFKMLNTPVTFEMYDQYCVRIHQQPPSDEGWGRANRPVINVNFFNASDFARWLSEKTGWNCQLPTEEQWEYACRAGTYTDYWYGDIPDPRMMVMGTGKTMPTPGPRMANPWDLYDMHGNVWEWTASNKHGEHILCGGSWYNKANWLTCTSRNISFPNACNNNWGFRLIREL
jgi:formylglycine-generating enzyme required for sulfatase activity